MAISVNQHKWLSIENGMEEISGYEDCCPVECKNYVLSEDEKALISRRLHIDTNGSDLQIRKYIMEYHFGKGIHKKATQKIKGKVITNEDVVYANRNGFMVFTSRFYRMVNMFVKNCKYSTNKISKAYRLLDRYARKKHGKQVESLNFTLSGNCVIEEDEEYDKKLDEEDEKPKPKIVEEKCSHITVCSEKPKPKKPKKKYKKKKYPYKQMTTEELISVMKTLDFLNDDFKNGLDNKSKDEILFFIKDWSIPTNEFSDILEKIKVANITVCSDNEITEDDFSFLYE